MNKKCTRILVILMVLGLKMGYAGGVRDFADSWPIDGAFAREFLTGENKPALLVMVGQGRLFEMPELGQTFLGFRGELSGAAFSLGGGAHWQRTGSGLFGEDLLEGELVHGERPSLGLAATYWQQTLGGRREKSFFEMDLLWGWRFHSREISGQLDVKWPLAKTTQVLGGRRRRTLLKFTLWHQALAAAMVLDRHEDGSPHFGFHLLLAVDRGVGLECRADAATGSVGPGLSFVRGWLMLRTSHVIHPQLGVTHRLMLVMGKPGGGV